MKKVQVWMHNDETDLPSGRYFSDAPWRDAEILPPPKIWGGDIPNNRIPNLTMNFDFETSQPKMWPIRLTKAHWAVLLPGLRKGKYTLRCRSIDDKGFAQPLPRPFRKSGHAAIHRVSLVVG